MHSSFSADSTVEPELIINQAINNGLSHIAITDHLDYLWYDAKELYEFDLDEYFKVLSDLKNKYADKIDLNIGVEFGFRNEADCVEPIKKYWENVKKYPFDFIIGSTHLYDHGDPYYESFWANKSSRQVIREYYEAMYENFTNFDGYSVAGHIDYVTRYVPKDIHYEITRDLDIIEAILKLIIENGHGIEINTSRLNKGFNKPNPDPIILDMYKSLGGEIITIGSDAHKLGFVGGNFDRAVEYLKAAGFKYYSIFKNMKPEFIEL